MLNKLYVKIKQFIKENYKIIITTVLLYFILTFPLPYYIYNGGGILNLDKRIEIDNNKNKQDINMCYVNELKGNVGTFLLSYIVPSWDKEKIVNTDFDYEEELYRNKILLSESINNATINAYKLSNNNYEIIGEKVLITYIFDEAKTDLKVGDQITKVDNTYIHSMEELNTLISSKEINSKINIEVMSKEKKKQREAKVIEIDGEKKIGIGITLNYIIEAKPNVKVKFKDNEAGPSGGLMMAIGIYDKLTNSKISQNKKICGTGTIDIDGNVGEIGGVKYKLKGAVDSGCDIFLAPSDNFKEVKEEKKKNKYKIKIYEAKTFNETIEYLKN